MEASEKPIDGISRLAKEMLSGKGLRTLGDIFPRFGPAGLIAQLPALSQNDLFQLAAVLRENFGKENARKHGWTKGQVRKLPKRPTNGDFPLGTDQGVINRFNHSATSGKHYKKPRWRRHL
jgi:hypothetical protein